MVESNKILTVSYGTFSCTLEGFDDSFSTMKAIAEYFRDLAAGDRYFGAEPPTPDADMLARIAEKEITRRVEARMESSGLVLRAMGAIGSDEAKTAAPAAARPAMPPARPARPAPVAQDAPQADMSVDNDEDYGAEDVSQMADDPAPEPRLSVSEVGATAPTVGDIDGPGASVLAATGPAMTSDAGGDVMPRAPAASPRPGRTIRMAPAIPAHPDADSVAAKLQRIRAVVGKASTGIAAAEVTDYVEDLNLAPVTAAPDAAEDEDILSRLAADTVAAPAPAPVADPEAADLTPETDDEIDLSRFLVSDAVPEVDEDAARLAAFDAVADQDSVVEDEDDHDDGDEDLDDLSDAEIGLAGPMDADLMAEDDYADFEDEDEGDAPASEPAPAPVRARVIRMKRAEFDAALESGQIEAATEEPTENTSVAAEQPADNLAALDGIDDLEHFAQVTDDATLDQDDEASLLEELAEVEREIAAATPGPVATLDDEDFDDEDYDDEDLDDEDFDDESIFDEDDEDDIAAQAPASVLPKRPGRAILEREPEDDEDGLSRILSMTDAHLNEPESNRRRAAISQLKAAVAATEAARRMGEANAEEDGPENAFRDDLNQVVRPRRTALSEHRTERPRPAPLKLVASQRIDTRPAAAAAGPVTPVRPRRVSVDEAPATPIVTAASAAATEMAGSFSEFAENMGARDLGDLLEAAAAYTSFVEGLEDFSRPQLMKKVREAVNEDFSREDGLRSFGTLLRQGRIERVRNGRFQVSEQTRYRPEPRAARG